MDNLLTLTVSSLNSQPKIRMASCLALKVRLHVNARTAGLFLAAQKADTPYLIGGELKSQQNAMSCQYVTETVLPSSPFECYSHIRIKVVRTQAYLTLTNIYKI